MGKLIITSGDGRGKSYEVNRELMIGRHPECGIVLNDMHASRFHAKTYPMPDGVYIEDNGSANGTFVNGEQVKRHRMADGDEICVSATFFLYMDAPAPGAAAKPTGMQQLSASRQSIVTLSPDKNPDAMEVGDAKSLIVGPTSGSAVDNAIVIKLQKRLQMLLELGASLTATDLPALLNQIMDRLYEIFPQATRGFVFLCEDPGKLNMENLQPAVQRNRDARPGSSATEGLQISRTVLNKCLNEKQSVWLQDSPNFSGSMVNLQITSVMCVPMLLGSEVLGVTYIDTKEMQRAFTQDDLAMLTTVGAQAAAAIQNSRLAQKYASENEMRNQLARYISPDLVDRIVRKEIDIKPGGTRKRGTIFFSDIIGFSKMSLKIPAEEVVALLNQYFRVMQEIIFDFGGTVDKFGGDAIMAFWGVLVATPDAALNGTAAGLEMQNKLYVFNHMRRSKATVDMPVDEVRMGIGLSTGEFVAGNIGSEQKFEYTVIGETVNLAARVESLAGFGQTFVSQGSYDEVAAKVLAIRMPDCHVKGWEKPVPIYSIRGAVVQRNNMPMIILSFPVQLKGADGTTMNAEQPSVITRAYPTRTSLELELWTYSALAEGDPIAVQIAIREKKNLSAIQCKVKATQDIQSEALGHYYIMRLSVVSLPPDIMQLFRIGDPKQSDLTEEEVIRE